MDGKISSRNSSHGQHLGKKSGNGILRIMIDLIDLCSSVYLFFITEMRVGSANIREIAGTARQGMDTPDSLFFFLSPGGEDERGYRFDAWLGLVCAYGHT